MQKSPGLKQPRCYKRAMQLSTLASEGQPCGFQAGSYVPCNGTTYCDSSSEKCVPKAADGETCSTESSNTCLYFAGCQNDLCVVDTEPTCP